MDLRLVQSQSLVTPACGTANLSEPDAVRTYELASALAAAWESLFKIGERITKRPGRTWMFRSH